MTISRQKGARQRHLSMSIATLTTRPWPIPSLVFQEFSAASTVSFGGARHERRPNSPMLTDPMPGPTPADELESLVREHLDAVYRVAFSVVRDSALAEDVAQDSILKAWNALPTFRGESTLRSWLLRITHNTAISTLRRRREEVRDPALLPELATTSSTTSSTTERQVVNRLSIAAFEEALDKLDDLSRAIVVLREIEGLSYDEIADIVEVPLPTVKTRLLRARRILAAGLEDWRP